MKYLVIGDAGSIHIFNFVKNVLLPRGYEVHLLTLSAEPVRDNFREFYKENEVIVHAISEKGYRKLNKKDRFHRLLNFVRKLKLMHDVPKVDICHVHSVYKTACVMVLGNKKKFKKLILSYWGGDIEDKSPSVVKLRKKCFEYADAITVTVRETYDEFHRIYGDHFNEKLHICRFATEGLEYIKKLSVDKSREDCRKTYGIKPGKVCVTVGYSAYAAQHQDKCLKIISLLPTSIRDKICVIIPMQYGRYDEGYIERVHKAAVLSEMDCRILEKFVPIEISAQLAIATDIYLHLRDTDAFSNALKEHIFAGSHVIKGDWLKYPELDEMKACIDSIPTFDSLGECLEKAVEETKIQDKITLFEPIYELYSIQAVKKQWNDLIEFVIRSREGKGW